MSANFRIKSYKVNEELHIELSGDFDGSSAWELVNMIMLRDNRNGRIIINVQKLGEVIPFGSALFKNLIDSRFLPADRMVFEGAKGLKMGLSGCKVLTGNEKYHFRNNGICKTRCSIM